MVDKMVLQQIFDKYLLPERVSDFSYLINNEKLEQSRIKKILRVATEAGNSYVVKVVKELEHPPQVIEQQSVLSETYRSNGLIVPRRHMSLGGSYAYIENISGYDCSITLEDDLGEKELEVVNRKYVRELGSTMAKMHSVSENNDCHIGIGTIWDFLNDHSDIMLGYRIFTSLDGTYELNGSSRVLYEEINRVYRAKRESLQKRWGNLPKFAVQGDFSTNNVIVGDNGEIRGIIDFNIAGDEVLVNDLVTEGIFIAYIMDLDNALTDTDRPQLLDEFINSYTQTRALNEMELSVMNPIYTIVFPFLWPKIEYLESCFKDNNQTEVERTLEEIRHQMSSPYLI